MDSNEILINVTKTVVCRIIHENITLRMTHLIWSRRDLYMQPHDLESGALPLRHEILSYNLIYIILLAEVQSFQEVVDPVVKLIITRLNLVFWKFQPE
jgi:hypothetical protein